MNRIDGASPLSTTRTQQGQGAGAVDSAGGRDRANESEGAAAGLDRVNLSSRSRIMAVASQAVASSPDVRAAKVAALKASIANGAYQADAGHVASRLFASGTFGAS
jgi:flagellar biosynthesis anti-sigma factor FlgM